MSTRPTTLREWALYYATHPWPIFPVKARGKEPLTLAGFKAATTDAAKITKWWDTWPDANVACVPGQTGHLVIDIDGEEGEAAARALGLRSEPTLTVLTSRGRHLWFKHPGGSIGNVILAPHLDVRADHGYVLLPPSVHPSGGVYRWEHRLTEVKALSPDVVALFNGHRRPTPLGELPAVIPEGERNQTLFRYGCWMRAKGFSLAGIRAALEVENASRCRPSLDARELAQLVESIGRYEAGTAVPEPVAPVPSTRRRWWGPTAGAGP